MATSVNGTAGITFNDGSVLGSQLGIFNRIIDGGFIINQRGYTSGTALSAGSYGHDRWKAGSGGCTYTFTQGALGVNTTITITAGTLVQVIEGCNLAEGGTYVLSWTGTAQGRLNGGTYGSSGTVTVTGWTAGTNLNVEFNTGTLGNVQLVAGSAVSSYAYRPYGTELALCQRYYYRVSSPATWGLAMINASNVARVFTPFPMTMRIAPTALEQNGTAGNYGIASAGANPASTSVPTFWQGDTLSAVTNFNTSGLTAGQSGLSYNVSGTPYLGWSAEL